MREHWPLTKGETRKLFREIEKYLSVYRTELGIYERFIETYAEQPIGEKRYGKCSQEKAAQGAPKIGEKEKASDEGSSKGVIEASVEFQASSEYASSPWPFFDF